MSIEPFSLTYKDLEVRYGNKMAYDLLLTIEKLAKARDAIDHAEMNNELRLRFALDRLSGIDFAAAQ